MTVFVKRYPSKGEFPDKDDVYVVRTAAGITRIVAYIVDKGSFELGLLGNDIKNENVDWWLEEIELPSEEDVFNNRTFYSDFETFEQGANYIINHLKQK